MWTVSQRTDKEKSAQSQNSGELHGLAPDFKRSEAVLQVDPLIVVESHILRHRLFDLVLSRIMRKKVCRLRLNEVNRQ